MQRICYSMAAWGYQTVLIGRELPSSQPFTFTGVESIRVKNKNLKGPKFYLEHNINLFKALWKLKPTLVYGVDADTLVATTLYCRITDTPLIFDAHEYFSELPEVVNRPIIKAIWHWVEKVGIGFSAARITVSDELASLMGEDFGTTFQSLRNIAPYKDPRPAAPKTEPYFVYAGAVNLGRGIELLVNAGASLPCPVHIVGDGDMLAWLKEQVSKSPILQEKIVIHGFLPPSEMEAIIANAYAGFTFAMPAGESYTLGLGNKFFDYIQARIPQICPALPAYLAMLSKYNIGIACPYNSEAVVEAMQLLLNDKLVYRTYQNNTEAAAKELCWEHESEKLKAILQQVSAM